MPTESPSYTAAQRAWALAYGVATHTAFAFAVASMVYGLFTGLRHGFGHATGHWTWPANLALILQFPLLHSFLLSQRGRRWLGRLAPPSLRRELSTTVFALVSSLQLGLCFAAWSPLPSFVWTPGPVLFAMLSLLYAASWAMLVVAMREAGLAVQLGSLGWRAVWQRRAVRYPPLPTGFLHRHVRQPIYIAFTLILWTAPTWSIDRLIFTLGWTAYCVVGALLKEQRYRRLFGDAFKAYQQRVPFWFPRFARAGADASAAREPAHEILVVGAGPVGLLLANLLGRAGLDVCVVEARTEPRRHSMAIGITPPSLDVLGDLGLSDAFIRAGVRIHRATVHEDRTPVGRLGFAGVDGTHRYILSLPQVETERLLDERLRAEPRVRIQRGWSVVRLHRDRDGARVDVRELNSGREETLRARYVIACDGAHSPLRALARLHARRKRYSPCFTMADYVDTTDLGDEAHLYFSPERPVESFPLPGGYRRWIIRTGWRDETDLCEPFEQTIARLTGHRLPAAACVWRSGFQPRRHELRRFFSDRVIFCGDAAHGMSPIGGQGMNTGFGDAALLAHTMRLILRDGAHPARALAAYSRARRTAFRRAADRAAIGMWLGTRTGPLASRLRGLLVARLLRHPSTHHQAARWFTMRSLPPLVYPEKRQMPDAKPPKRPLLERWRIRCSRMMGYGLLASLLVVGSRWESHPLLETSFFLAGCFLAGLAMVGRLWCSLYICGYKTNHLIMEGPYSLSRNPLYVFSLLGAIGIGLTTETLTVPLVVAAFFALYYPAVIRAEEAKLRGRHAGTFDQYCRAVPRFWPRHFQMMEPPLYPIRPAAFRKAMLSVVWFAILIGVVEMAESLRDAKLIPVLASVW